MRKLLLACLCAITLGLTTACSSDDDSDKVRQADGRLLTHENDRQYYGILWYSEDSKTTIQFGTPTIYVHSSGYVNFYGMYVSSPGIIGYYVSKWNGTEIFVFRDSPNTDDFSITSLNTIFVSANVITVPKNNLGIPEGVYRQLSTQPGV